MPFCQEEDGLDSACFGLKLAKNMKKRKRRNYGYVGEKSRKTAVHSEDAPQPKKGVQKLPQAAKTLGVGLWAIVSFFGRILLWFLRLPIVAFQLHRGKNPADRALVRKKIYTGIIAVLVLGFVSLTILFAWASKDLPDPDKLTDRQVAQSTKILDRTGEHLLYEIFSEKKRTLVQLDDIPAAVINGVIATEDTAFYEHKGVRPFSILRSFATGRGGGGASTLTQQLVKNAILSNERTVSRKAKEFLLSIRLEQKYSKEQILQIYFNEIPYGSTNYGIQSASQAYFGKDVSELTLSESAVLAGFPKAPTRYLNNSEALKTRRDFVLKRMADEGFITQEEKESAQAEELKLNRRVESIDAPHFVLHVKEQLVEEFGEQIVETGGLNVITSLDWKMQQAAEEALHSYVSSTFQEAGADNAALVSIDPTNGHVMAMVGSADFYDEDIDGQFNVATLGRRQPGSSFKPIVYTAAFEKGYTPETVLFDVVTDFGGNSGRSYKPLNYNLQELGPVTMRQALQGSLNIPAVKALYLVGEKKGVEFAERLGYTTLKANNFGLSLVLGGGEVTLMEHVNAYTTFANGGLLREPVTVLSVETPEGDTLKEWKRNKGDRVLDEAVAATITHVLSDDAARAYAFGAGGVLTLPDRPVAAKTGTTNSYVDAWTVGYTPQLVTGVWAGNTDNTPMNRGFGGSKVAAPIWKAFMAKAHEGKPVVPFPTPPRNDAKKAVLQGSEGGSVTVKVDKITGKLASSSTPEQYIVERTYTQPHSLLHYVVKDDPRGDIPSNPAVDPQYQIWEDAIQDWIRRKKEQNPDWEISFEDPPTEYDDIHSLELIPTLQVVYPAPSTTITTRPIQTDIRVSAPRGVAKVTYQIDDKFVQVVREHPFNLNYAALGFQNGPHTLTVIVEDDVGNRLEQTIPFVLRAGEVAAGFRWRDDQRTVQANTGSKSFTLSHVALDDITRVRVMLRKDGNEEQVFSADAPFDLFNDALVVTIDSFSSAGDAQLVVQSFTESGLSHQETLDVTVE